jgi:Tol biopolymer transport system component
LGPEAPLIEGVRTEVGAGAAQFAFSSNGTLVYVPGGDASEARLVWVDRQGRESPLALDPQPFGALRLSRDGERLAIGVAGIRDQIRIYDLVRSTHVQLTSDAHDRYPSWTRDDEWVTFTSTRVQPNGIFARPASGAGEALELVATGARCFSGPWTADGRFLAYTQIDPETASDIWILPAGEGRQPRPIVQSSFNEWAPVFSPDGGWLAFVSDETGRYEVYVQEFPGGRTQQRFQISNEGGEEPVWSEDGAEIFYRNSRRWMVTQVDTRDGFSAAPPQLLFEGEYLNIPGSSFAVSPDGQRILALAEADPLPPRQINVILDWLAALTSR